jgi:hypothetical protein
MLRTLGSTEYHVLLTIVTEFKSGPFNVAEIGRLLPSINISNVHRAVGKLVGWMLDPGPTPRTYQLKPFSEVRRSDTTFKSGSQIELNRAVFDIYRFNTDRYLRHAYQEMRSCVTNTNIYKLDIFI